MFALLSVLARSSCSVQQYAVCSKIANQSWTSHAQHKLQRYATFTSIFASYLTLCLYKLCACVCSAPRIAWTGRQRARAVWNTHDSKWKYSAVSAVTVPCTNPCLCLLQMIRYELIDQKSHFQGYIVWFLVRCFMHINLYAHNHRGTCTLGKGTVQM